MTFEVVKGVPRQTCHYKHDAQNPGIMQADCNGEWIVLQETWTHCPFCGHVIERNPPPRPRTVA